MKNRERLIKKCVKLARKEVDKLEGSGVFSTEYYNQLIEKFTEKIYTGLINEAF